MSAFWDHARCEVAIDKVLEVVSGEPVSLRWAQALGRDCGKKGDILMVEVVFPPVTRRAGNKNKSEMNRCLPIWLSGPTSHQPSRRPGEGRYWPRPCPPLIRRCAAPSPGGRRDFVPLPPGEGGRRPGEGRYWP